jgi:hypothetical protein
MKLFQQLLVAPAALGLLAPLAANAAEVNINDVASYATPGAEVTTVQFSDVVPGDWAYTALLNLSESYGCVDNAYTQTLKSGQALTRYEAAALVNACLEGGVASADINSDAVRLSNEFGTEMAILKGRVDGLEYKVKEISAGQFSSATKMSGSAVFTTGVVENGSVDNTNDEKLSSSYAYAIDLNTGFANRSNLYVGLEAGNTAATSPIRMDSVGPASNSVAVTSLYYTWPVGDDFQLTAGPLVDEDDVISASTSAYSDSFRLSGNRFTTGDDVTGTGAAIAYANDSGFNASFSVVTAEASATAAATGIWTKGSDDVITASIGYDAENYGGGVIYKSEDESSNTGSKEFGLGAYFRPDGFPTISVTYDTQDQESNSKDSTSLVIGLDYPVGPGTLSAAYESLDDAFTSANSVTSKNNWELYYNYPVSDGIAVQGGIFVEEKPGSDTTDTTGYVVETFFSF